MYKKALLNLRKAMEEKEKPTAVVEANKAMRPHSFQSPHVIFSAENPYFKQTLKMKHDDVVTMLKQKGFDVDELKGKYGGNHERSIMVKNPLPEHYPHFHEMARRLGQDSMIISNGHDHEMHYLGADKLGQHVKGQGTDWSAKEPEDNYSTSGDGQHFTHQFNHSQTFGSPSYLTPKPKKMDKSEMDLMKAPMILHDSISDRMGRDELDRTAPAHKHVATNQLKNGLYHHAFDKGDSFHHVLSTDAEPTNHKQYVAQLTGDRDHEHGMQVFHSLVDAKHKGKGYGKQLYLSALAHHGKMASDNRLTARSHKAWQNLPAASNNTVVVKLANTVSDSIHDSKSPERATFHTAHADQEALRGYLFKPQADAKLAASESMDSSLTKSAKDHPLNNQHANMHLIHYSPQEGLTNIDPNYHGVRGIGSEAKQGAPEHKMAFYYLEGVKPETIVTTGAKAKYVTQLGNKKLYDIASDKDNLHSQAQKLADMRATNPGVVRREDFHQAIRDAGYHGIYNSGLDNTMSHAVGMFEPMEVKSAHKMHPNDFEQTSAKDHHAIEQSKNKIQPHPNSYDWHDGHTDHHEKEELKKHDEAMGTKKQTKPEAPLAPTNNSMEHPHSNAHGPSKIAAEPNEQAGGVTTESFHNVMQHYGTMNPAAKSSLKFYKGLENHSEGVNKLLGKHGYNAYYAGGKYGKPDLANKNYNNKNLMIYDPTPQSGGDFGDEGFTDTWRKSHELAHALTYPEINSLYGEGRRLGKLGVRSPNEMKRAVHWEWLAAHKQRDLMKELGYHMPDEDFHKELNTVMGDAVHRSVTGKFTEPSEMGFTPHSHKVPLEHALGQIDAAGKALGLEHEHDTLAELKKRRESMGKSELKKGMFANLHRAHKKRHKGSKDTMAAHHAALSPIVTEDPLDKAEGGYKVGDRVNHKVHGVGTVRGSTSDGHHMVNFDSNQTRDFSGKKVHPNDFVKPKLKKSDVTVPEQLDNRISKLVARKPNVLEKHPEWGKYKKKYFNKTEENQ